ncbi:transposase [Streptomyces asoensis]|uniref:transposase n=1 Tax=Streptomyces asoensis TaxID=249586 RepID=UPI003400EC66
MPWSTTSRPGRPRRGPDALLGDKGYGSNAHRDELRRPRILPVISRKGSPNLKGLGKLRYVVEQTFALLHELERLAVRWERRTELHDAFVSLACSLICWRRLREPKNERPVSGQARAPAGRFRTLVPSEPTARQGRRPWEPCRRALRAAGSEELASVSSSVD